MSSSRTSMSASSSPSVSIALTTAGERGLSMAMNSRAAVSSSPLPACGERSTSERKRGSRMRGRHRESEFGENAPLTRLAPSVLATLSPQAGRGKNLRRLLRRHLVHFAGLQIDAHAIDLVEVGAGDAHEAGVVGIVDRVDGAVLVDAGHAGLEPVCLDRLELGVPGVAAVVLVLPLGHLGVFGRLAVDR